MLSLREVAEFTGGRIVSERIDGEAERISHVSTDSRRIEPGALFVALTGEHFDGHAFLDDVAARGAAAVLVERGRTPQSLPAIAVTDTRAALGDLANGWRARFSMPLVVVTGSNGKTTTKEMIAAILAAAYGAPDRCATEGNLNNDIGVPLTLLRLRTHHRAAVVELGMNHPGETERLAQIAGPTIALVLNAQREHQEFMQSVAAVADEHALAIEALPDHGIAVFPGDDAYTPVWRRAAGARRVIDFASVSDHDAAAPRAAVVARAHFDADDMVVHLDTPQGAITVRLAVSGLHNARNAAAAAAATLAVDVGLDAIPRGLEAFRPASGRSHRFTSATGATVIDDSYNANPDSMRAAVDLLATYAAPRLLVLGDMGEVGSDGARFHAEIGAHARDRGIEALFATGAASRDTVAAFGARGVHFDDADALTTAVGAWVDGHAQAKRPAILVKGSRFMRMERVVAALRDPLATASVVEGAH